MKNTFYISLLTILFSACIGDDIILDTVEESLKITVQASSIAVGETFQFEARFTNNIGETEEGKVIWSSSDENILVIDANGLATAVAQGNASIYADVDLVDGTTLREEMVIEISMITTVVEAPTSRAGTIVTTSQYTLEGAFELSEVDNKLILNIGEDYKATTALPGLYIYLTNNPNSIGDALEIGAVEVFEGVHSYEIENVGLVDYDYVLYFCKPFRVKVGDGEIN